MAGIKKKREAGRPRETQAVGREGLIEATLALLRHAPPEALTLLQIANSVGVDPALVRYYFGNKDGLLRAATLNLMERVQQASEQQADEPSVAAMLGNRVRLIIDTGRENPHFLKLVMREIYAAGERGEAGDPTWDVLDLTARRGAALSNAVLQARPTSAKEVSVDARFLHVALLGACTFFATAQPLFKALFELEQDEDELANRYSEFLTDLLLRGIGVDGTTF
ncbi:TetR/AcrR family transcriptional regulator [Pseudomonas capeferrum]|uniref:TetR/AcrR family transcriptional regulator n=1 Tax=Pseudomonas capeferrum TaxID=1495066 RepID=UPI0015E382AA|nr:TetR/AcrR family transcriptional regulator [Pseudomonas capeferrum]MBA1201442.1 TetR/AcrR family transcriptional regulator [Pseudomonas capeferrum]